MSERITVHNEGRAIYDIVIEDSFVNLPGELQKAALTGKKLCIVSDSNVAGHYLAALEKLLAPVAAKVTAFVFPAGEENKNLDTVKALYTKLIEEAFDRKDLLIALGGGVVGDLTGYCAATYLRGIDFIQVPTSLLAQVDSSIGGKTGVDFDSYKNMVGAFHQPRLVYMNLTTLLTLPEKEYFSGMGEIIKHGLIKDREYYRWLFANKNAIKERNLTVCEKMLVGSCHIKRQVVEADPKEQGERALLNFGHTVGHAVEKLMDFSLLHGECVAIGMVSGMAMSVKRGYLELEEYQEFLELLQEFGLMTKVSGLSPAAITEAMKRDKKMEAGQIKFILLKSIGQAIMATDTTPDELLAGVNTILS